MNTEEDKDETVEIKSDTECAECGSFDVMVQPVDCSCWCAECGADR